MCATPRWQDATARFSAQVLGPRFEQMCREFALAAPAGLFGALPGEVGTGVVADPARRSQIEVDVVVFAPTVPGEPRRILSLGEAKWGDVLGARHVDRLRRARDLLAGRGYDTRDTVLACYGAAGFDPDLSVPGDHVLGCRPGRAVRGDQGRVSASLASGSVQPMRSVALDCC